MSTRWLLLTAFAAGAALFSSFLKALFFAACLACAFRPLSRRLEAWRGPLVAAGLTTALAGMCLVIPVAVVGSLAAPQAVQGLAVLDGLRESNWFTSPEAQQLVDDIDARLRDLPGLEGGLRGLARNAAGILGTAARTALAGGVGLAGGALNAVLQGFIVLMLIFVFTAYARHIQRFALALLPMPRAMLDRCVTAFRGAVVGVLAGVVLVAAIQGVLCGIGFAVAGVPQAAFWGFIAAMVAPIPVVGTMAVWIPACAWLWFAGKTTAAIGLVLWSAIIVSGSDNILRPIFLKTGIEAPIALIFLAIICGLAAFGPMGLLLGPVLLALGLQLAREGLPGAPGVSGVSGAVEPRE